MIDEAWLAKALERSAARWTIPGAAIGLWHGGAEVTATTGVLNADTGQEVADDSLFQIGSITKVITATLIMILRDRGLIELDRPVRDYIPDFRVADLGASRSISVRQLLNHTAGLSGDFMCDTGAPPDELERYLQRCALLPLCQPVGEGFSYSNAAYVLAGLLIERVGGLPFYRAMEQWLFQPLGLTNSVVDPDKIPWDRASAGHSPDPDRPGRMKPLGSIHIIPASTAPAGATTMMTVSDLLAFARLHLAGGVAPSGERILSEQSVAEMQRMDVTIPIAQRDISHWGLGWFGTAQGASTLFGHDGGTVGQYSFLRLHRPTNTIIALLTNGGSANDGMIELFDEILEPLTGFAHTPAPQPCDHAPADLEQYVGRFETVATKTDFWAENGTLMRKAVMTLGDTELPEPASPLVYAGDDTFLNYPASGDRPTLVTFTDKDERGIPQTLFSGLRVARRTLPL